MTLETVNLTYKNDYAILQLDRGRANVINAQMVDEVRKTVELLKDDHTVRGVILTGKDHFFSAGLDVIELFDYDKEKIRKFFIDFLNMFCELVRFPKPIVAAITGHCPAGGCILAITCDYRIMAEGEKYTIGLNEVAVNILIADIIPIVYSYWLGTRRSHQLLLEGRLLHVSEAKEIGLIDEVCPMDEVLPKAEKYLKKLLFADQDILVGTKAALRRELHERMDMDLEQYADDNMDVWWKPEVRSRMKAFVEALKSKKGK